MIIVLFGQPGSGKTTLAHKLVECYGADYPHHVDGDKLREVFQHKDYSKEGRIKNLNRASDLAVYLNSFEKDVILSLVYPYQEARDYLNNLSKDVKWVYLTYKDDRKKQQFRVKDFEDVQTEEILHLDTTWSTEECCVDEIKKFIN